MLISSILVRVTRGDIAHKPNISEGLSPFQWMFLAGRGGSAPSSYSTVQIGRVINQPDNKWWRISGSVLMDHTSEADTYDLMGLICDFHCPMSLMVRLNCRGAGNEVGWAPRKKRNERGIGQQHLPSAAVSLKNDLLSYYILAQLPVVWEYPWKILLNTSINSCASQKPFYDVRN